MRPFILIDRTRSPADKTALLVLSGVRDSETGRRAAIDWYPRCGYDIYIPDYISRWGIDGCVRRLEVFVKQYGLGNYRHLYAFCYIMGGWTLNRYLRSRKMPNLTKIVYNRSPYQEQAPRIAVKSLPLKTWLRFGRTLRELADTPYPSLPKGDRTIGLLVECRATPFVREHRERVRALTVDAWEASAFGQAYDDCMFAFLHHDELYYSFGAIGGDLRSFYETGRFSAEASRRRVGRDPFE